MEAEQITEMLDLGGRKWRPIRRRIMWNITELDAEVLAAGLDGIQQKRDESTEQFASRIWARMSGARKVYSFLGLLLMPAELPDEDWTPEVAAQTGHFFQRVSAPEEQQILKYRLIGLVLYFFVKGLGSWDSTDTASPAAPIEAEPAETETGSLPISESGDPSSAN